MKYHCTANTDLNDLIGRESAAGFEYGPLTRALKAREELELENSAALPVLMTAKIALLLRGLFVVETEETFYQQPGFRLVLN